MPNYKIIKGHVGPWPEGTVITDADLKDHPGLGGVARLRDRLGVIEDTHEDATTDADNRAPENTTGSPARLTKRSADAFTGKAPAPAPQTGTTGPASPNAPSQPPAGKS